MQTPDKNFICHQLKYARSTVDEQEQMTRKRDRGLIQHLATTPCSILWPWAPTRPQLTATSTYIPTIECAALVMGTRNLFACIVAVKEQAASLIHPRQIKFTAFLHGHDRSTSSCQLPQRTQTGCSVSITKQIPWIWLYPHQNAAWRSSHAQYALTC